MNDNHMSSLIFRRLPYYLSPQFDIYRHLEKRLKGKRVLEVGFGTGLGVMQYADDAESVEAIDIDLAAVNFAKRSFPLRKVRWSQGDILTFPSGDIGEYDYAIMIEVLEHVGDQRQALGQLRWALKPGGSALITVPNKDRSRYRRDPNGAPEWTPPEFARGLGKVFEEVVLLDYQLRPMSTRYKFDTPIIAEVTRGS